MHHANFRRYACDRLSIFRNQGCSNISCHHKLLCPATPSTLGVFMEKRQFLNCITAAALSTMMHREAKAWVPLLTWLWRAASLLRGQALRMGTRTIATNGARRAVSAAVLAHRASRTARALKAVTAFSLTTVAIDEVLAHVQGTPEDSILRWTLAYYSVLTQSDSDAAMGMWVEPPDPKHFHHLDKIRPLYRVTRLEDRGGATSRVWVLAKNPGEKQTSHVVDISWKETEHGMRVSNFQSVT